MKKFICLCLLCTPFAFCTKESAEPIGQLSDSKLYSLLDDSSQYFRYYYNNPNVFYTPAGSSPHGIFKLRFNAKAQSVFVASKLPVNGTFPDSSLVIKDVYDQANGNLIIYSVMYKLQGKWNWAEYNADGSVLHGIYKNPGICTSCHGASVNRDLVASFDLH